MSLTRRQALRFCGIAGLGLLMEGCAAIPANISRPSRAGLYVTASGVGDKSKGDFRVSGLHPDGSVVFDLPLPGRGHGSAIRHAQGRSCGNQAVIFSRRPGNFAIVVNLDVGAEHRSLTPPADRYFYGHGVFSADGAWLYTTENDLATNQGVIGVWNASSGYRRVREFPSYGIGPHELILLSDNRTLAIANGGIWTDPDTGRHGLNIPTMNPSLAYVDSSTGTLIEQHGFTDPRQRKLSIRHLSANEAGTVCLALQDQGPRHDQLPLVAFHVRGEKDLTFAETPSRTTRRLRGYMGSASMDSSGGIAAVSAPRGGVVTFWNVATRKYVSEVRVPDGCGVAATTTPGAFLVTSGAGDVVLYNVISGHRTSVASPLNTERHWDNHLAAV